MQSFLSRGEPDIQTSIRKACSSEDAAPKRKHVRSCIVYTWDHRSGREFWNAIKLLPLQNDDVQCFKALITIHKVLQEGHKHVLRESFKHVNWLRNLKKNDYGQYANAGYSVLINEYIRFLVNKIEFHQGHTDFNGLFEYEEFISLRGTYDPNEGYENILDLMNLQDSIDDFQRKLFSTLSGRYGNECRISSLTGMVTESFGIYRFVTSMLRAMHSSNETDVLEPLRSRYYSQHRRLLNFYFDCSTLKYLTSLITIPELSEEAPNLFTTDEEAPSLPKRPLERSKTGDTQSLAPSTNTPISTGMNAPALEPQPTGDWWRQQQEFEQQQRELEQQQEQERQRQQQLAYQQQQQLEQQQQAFLQQQQQQALLQQQQQQQAELEYRQQHNNNNRVAELEQQVFNLQDLLDQAQQILPQYDQRVQNLEADLAQANTLSQDQINSQKSQIEQLQEQVQSWKSKYESLAKLYSQLRQEHLELLQKYKKAQARALSAAEAIEKREKLEKALKDKNIEMADMIKERDRARYELDSNRGQQRDETSRIGNNLREKEEENLILHETVTSLENALRELSTNPPQQKSGFQNILDAVLQSATDHVQEELFDFENPMEAGNPNATPPYILSIVEKVSMNSENFANALNDYFADESTGDQTAIIKPCMLVSNSLGDLLANVKGLSNMTKDQAVAESIVEPTSDAAVAVCAFFGSLNSDLLTGIDAEGKIELVISSQVEVQQALHELTSATEAIIPPMGIKDSGDVSELVDSEMAKVSSTIEDAHSKLATLRPRDPRYVAYDRHVNEAIISAAQTITLAIGALVKAATDCQNEIVAKGKGTSDRHAYYKKNSRWTQGLISAARAVAGATNVLIETADGTLSGKSSPEELIVASKEVSSSSAQLVAASRVKADYLSKSQERLESATKTVTNACRSLVTRVQDILSDKATAPEAQDYSKLSSYEFKAVSMEQQVEVLKLEQQLSDARNKLFEIRKLEYVHLDDE